MQLVDRAFLVELLDKPIVHQLVDVDIEDARIMKRHDLSHVRQVETRRIGLWLKLAQVGARRLLVSDAKGRPEGLHN